MVLLGASLGGAVAIDLALNYIDLALNDPDGVEQLILVDSVGFSGSFPFGQYLDASLLYWGANGLRFRKEIALQVLQMLPLVDPSLKDKVLCALLHQFHYRKHREPHYGCPDSGTAEITMILPCSMSAST